MFFKHFASKNQSPGLSIGGTLVENGLKTVLILWRHFIFFSLLINPIWFEFQNKTFITFPFCDRNFCGNSWIKQDGKLSVHKIKDIWTHFMPLVSFHTPWKCQKTGDFFILFGSYRKRLVAWNGLRKTILPAKKSHWLIPRYNHLLVCLEILFTFTY